MFHRMQPYRGPLPDTLGALDAAELALHLACPACDHEQRLGVAFLVAKYGRDKPIAEIAARGRCLMCGHVGAEPRLYDWRTAA